MRGRLLAAVVVGLLPGGCLPAIRDSDFVDGRREVTGVLRSGAPVTLTYLGVGGWLIETGRSQLLTAPLFTNPGLIETGLAEIHSDSAAIERGLADLDLPPLGGVAAILVGHAHYDHLMDVPYVARRLAPRATILGNTTVKHTLAPFAADGLDTSRVVDVSSSAANVEGGGRWIRVAPDLRVLPLESDHAPHFQGVTLYQGTRDAPMPFKPRSASEWLEGETLAWLIDVLGPGDEVRLRIYYQDAVAREPYGLMPRDLDRVDVALVVPATYAEADWQPEAVIENTRPRHVLLGHWENFFEPTTVDAEPVPFTLLTDFRLRLRRALDGDDSRWSLPRPGARFVFR